MLQPRLLPYRSPLCQRCFHSVSRQFYSTEVQRRRDTSSVTNAQADIIFTPDDLQQVKDENILRKFKPRSPGRRNLVRPINDHLYPGRPYFPLTFSRKGQHIGGRNRDGHVTVRHRGGGHKRRIRTIDFHRMAPGKQKVERIEHDPGRSAHIALLSNRQGDKTQYTYIVAPHGLREGQVVESYRAGLPAELKEELGGSTEAGLLATKTISPGNCMPLYMIPTGTTIFNVGLKKGGPAKICRSAGSYASIVGANEGDPKWADFIDVKLKSGEVRRIHRDCCGTIGMASNIYRHRRRLGKAGRKRWLGIRPTVRGLAMNAMDHPHGGGRGKSKGNRHPSSPWGQLVRIRTIACLHYVSKEAD